MDKVDKKLLRETETAKMLEDVDLEWSIVAYLSNAPFEHIQEVREKIKTQHFYHDAPRHIYQLICWFNDKGENVTPMLLQPEIMRRGKIKIEEFTRMLSYQNTFSTYVDLLHHLPLLVDYAKRRNLWLVGQKMIREGTCVGAEFNRVAEEIKTEIDDIIYDTAEHGSVNMQELLKDIQDLVDINLSGQNNDLCIPSGFDFIDDHDGLSKGDLDVIAAASSVGKTSFAVSMAINIMTQGYDIAFFSTEMKPIQICARVLSHYTKLYSSTILKKQMTEKQIGDYNEGVSQVYDVSKHLHFHKKNTTNFNEIIQSIRKLHSEHHIKGVFVDFIQRLTGQERDEKKSDFYARVSQRFKDLAQELDIWVVMLSQFNRNNENSKETTVNTKYFPDLDRLRGSGEIVEAADNVWLIYRPEYYNKEKGTNITYPAPYQDVVTEGTAMIIQAKGRNVGTGSFICGFDANTTHYYNLKEIPTRGLSEGQAQNAINAAYGKDNVLPF